jgi:hypothetical protein
MILKEQEQGITPPSYWKFSKHHDEDLKEAVSKYYAELKIFYGNNKLVNVLTEIQNRCNNIVLLATTTPATTNIKIGDKETYSVFDKRLVTLLYEHYILQIFNEYIHLTTDDDMANKMIVASETSQQGFILDMTQQEDEIKRGNVVELQKNVAKLLMAFINIIMVSKSTIDVTHDTIADELFKLKESEKYTFLDRFKEIASKEATPEEQDRVFREEMEVDNILKIYRLGPLWSRALMKGSYDPDNYEIDKEMAMKIDEIQKRTRKNNEFEVTDRNENILMDETIQQDQNEQEIDDDAYGMGHMNEDYNDGDYYGDEQENNEEYY